MVDEREFAVLSQTMELPGAPIAASVRLLDGAAGASRCQFHAQGSRGCPWESTAKARP